MGGPLRDVWIATGLTIVLLAVLLCVPLPESQVVQLRERDSGGTVHLKSGQELAITLSSFVGVPHTWQVTGADQQMLRWAAPEYRERKPSGPGGPVDVVWRFQTVKVGKTTVRLDLKPISGDEPRPVARTFSVQVVVD